MAVFTRPIKQIAAQLEKDLGLLSTVIIIYNIDRRMVPIHVGRRDGLRGRFYVIASSQARLNHMNLRNFATALTNRRSGREP